MVKTTPAPTKFRSIILAHTKHSKVGLQYVRHKIELGVLALVPTLNRALKYITIVKRDPMSRNTLLYWFLGLLLSRITFYFLGLRYDGNRLIDTFMQFPDVRLLTISNTSDIFFDFHASAPGLPMLYIFLHALSANYWWLIAYFGVFMLGVFANYCFYKFLVLNDFSKVISSLTTIFILGLNPGIILYEAQFYSTAIVAYSLIVILYLLKFSQLSKRYILVISLLLSNLVFMRSSYLVYLAIPLSFILLKRLFPVNSVPKKLTITLCAAILAIPIWAQASRIVKYDLPTMQASGATGVVLGLSSYSNFKGFPYASPGYYPFTESSTLNSKAQELNPDINSTPRKSNGLPNWNYDAYLEQYKLDSANLPKTLMENKTLLVPFLANSLTWSLTDPACSRVILPENYSALSFLNEFPRSLLLLRSPWTFENTQLSACAGRSLLDFSFLFILIMYVSFSIRSFIRFFGVVKHGNMNRDIYLLLLNLLVFFSVLASLFNGSPEVSKYRLESESYMFMLIIYFFTQARQQVKTKTLR